MKKISKNLCITLISFYIFLQIAFAQASGDFRTNSFSSFTGNWNVSTSWERFNGTTWDASGSGSNNPGKTPTSTNSVWIQTGAIITLTQNDSCKDLNICNSTTSSLSGSVPGRINIQTYTLNVSGKLNCYFGALGTVPGTNTSNGFSYYPFTGTTGKISIVGNTRNLANTGEWGATIGTPTNGFFPLEINLNSNQTVTMGANIKCTSLNILAGTLDLVSGIMSLDNGTDGQGDITIFNSANITCSTSGSATNIFQKTTSKRCGTLTINPGGTFTVLGGTPRLDVNAIVFNGTVNYSNNGNQKLLQKNKDALSASIINYSNIILSGSGIKTIDSGQSITVNGKLSMQGTVSLALGSSSSIAYGTNGILEYTGTGLQTVSSASYEWPNTNGPVNLSINNLSGVSLTVARNITGNVNLNSGNFNTNNNLTLVSTGSLNYLGGTISNFTLPSTLNNFILNSTTNLSGNLILNGTLALGNNTLNIAGNTLTLNGDFTTGTGVIKSNGSGSIYVGGSGTLTNNLLFDQTTSGTTNRLQFFTLNRGTSASVTLGNNLEITGILTLTNGTFNTGGTLTLISDASGTASITTIQSSADILGNVKVQRFIPSVARRYRFLSSSINNANFEDWREEIFITGCHSTASHQSTSIGNLNWGFDATTSNNPSIYWYDETVVGTPNQGWTALTNNTNSLSNLNLPNGKGYRVLIRGDRSNNNRLNGTENTQNTVTLDLKGTINKGNISMPVSYTSSGTPSNDGWCLLGNPYPCAFDWNAFYDNGINFSNINPTVYIFDATTNAYINYNANSNSGSLTNGIIPHGAAFFVQTNAVSPSLTFTEIHKTTTSYSNTFKTLPDEMMVKFIADSIDIDKFTLKYMFDATDDFDTYDILKLQNPTVNLFSFGKDSIPLITSVRKFKSRTNDTIMLGISSTFIGSHKFEFANVKEFANGKNVYLVDDFTSTITDVIKNNIYNFDINSNPTSLGNNRFKIIVTDSFLMNTGINQLKTINKLHFSIFPNPATDRIFICTKNCLVTLAEIKIFDAIGKIILEKNNVSFDKDSTIELPLNKIIDGIYFIQITTPQGGTSSIKLIK